MGNPARFALALLLLLAPSAAASQSQPPAPIEGDRMRAYHAALAQRRLGGGQVYRLDDVAARVAEGEDLVRTGRTDEAIARLTELVEDPRFAPFAEDDAGRAAIFRLGDALAVAGVFDSARAYLRRVLAAE